MADDVWLVVGLGNPGPAYAGTRHNIGQLVLDELLNRVGGQLKASKRVQANVYEGRIAGTPGVRAVLARPRSYMNDSGGPVAGLLRFYKLEPDRLVVLQDEIDLPYGRMRVKFGGGDNGHNGLRAIRKSLDTGDYYRVRFGVGRPSGQRDPAGHVLNTFSTDERKELPFLVDRAADAVECLLTEGLEKTQATYNS